jgi:hypothetical protein
LSRRLVRDKSKLLPQRGVFAPEKFQFRENCFSGSQLTHRPVCHSRSSLLAAAVMK